MIRVMLVTEHTLLREGLRTILEEDAGLDLVVEAREGNEAANEAGTPKPDVIVMDLTISEALDAMKRLQDLAPESRIVIITMHSDPHDPRRLVDAGASACVSKHAAGSELIEASRTVHTGRCYVTQELAGAQESPNDGPGLQENPLNLLTDRELQIMRLLAAGETNREIAAALGVSIKTVNTHRLNILAKLRLRNNADLARFAVRNNLLEQE